jgi:hypothetical protein
MLSLVPHSVSRARAGFVRNPAAGWSINTPQWVLAPAPKSTPVSTPKVDMARVDRVVAVLTRFVATWAWRRREARIREAGARWTREVMSDNWANSVDAEFRRELVRRRRERNRLVALSNADWHAYCRAQIAEARDVGPLMEAWRDILWLREAQSIDFVREVAAQAQVWNEVVLHNTQKPAARRVARVVRNHFALDSDSE